MGISENIRNQLINSFKAEQKEYIQEITQGLLALEKQPAPQQKQALLNDIFRHAHSLKGGARAVGMTAIESLGHGLEDVLLLTKEGKLPLSAELFDLLYQSLDAIELIMERLSAGETNTPAKALALLAQLEELAAQSETQTTPPAQQKSENGTHQPDPIIPTAETPEPAPGSASSADETIRVSVNKLDALMNQFSELLGAKIRAEQRLTEVKQMQGFAAEWHKNWQGLRSHYSRILRHEDNGYGADIKALIDFAGHNQEQLRTFVSQSNMLYRQLANDTLRISLIIDELQEEIKRVRMLPLSTISAPFARMVRDLARSQNKEINLTINGAETELDKRVLEQIKDPLIHILRNAVDHGLETPTERAAANKPAEGNIYLSAAQQGNNVIITVADDGRGLNLPGIKTAALKRGLLNKTTAQKLSEAETANLIFHSGLSTSKIITDISGRGVGMDVVRQKVEDLHGALSVSTKAGAGTTFTLSLPLTLASSRGLLVTAGNQTFALPLSTVERMLHILPQDIKHVNGKPAISFLGKPVALAWLSQLLELPPAQTQSERLTVVIITVAEKRLGLAVDSLAGEQEIVIKSLGQQLARVGGIAGATLMGSGQVVLVLHPADLIKLAGRARKQKPAQIITENSPEKEREQKTVLVVDDSVTTRTLEKNILEAAGYQVNIAVNGEEALAALVSKGLPDIVISDVNMPYIDGFELTKRIKQDNRYQNIPVILVTSLDSAADKAKGIDVGADAYIVKGSFDQSNLLQTIKQLI